MMEKSLTSVAENIKRIQHEIAEECARCGRDPSEVQLMAVSKTQPPELVNHAISCGITLIGENRAQELTDKYDAYNKENLDIHFIGHMQSNKVKYIIDKVSMIQSVDSIKLAKEIDKQCKKIDKTMQVLIEVNIGGEDSKSGVPPAAVEELIRQIAEFETLKVSGLMTIPPISTEKAELDRYFSRMQALMVDIKGKNIDNINMDFLSMGMSGDYLHAIRHGSNILRLGSAIFGSRS